MFGSGDDTGIVSINTHNEAKRLAPLRVTEAYWHALCKDGEIPVRSAIDPRGMESALEHAFLLERIAPGMAKIRVAGSHLSDLMGMDVTGMPISAMIAAEGRDAFASAVTQLFAEPAILRLSLKAQEGFGRPALSGEMIILPLRSDFGEVTRALGAFVTDSRIGRAPRRFTLENVDIAPAAPNTLRRADLLHTAHTPAQATPTRTAAPAAQDAPAQDTPARGHLRLVVSND